MIRLIIIEVLIIASPVIAWLIGAIGLTRLGEIMFAFGVLGLALVVLTILNLRVPLGNVSRFLTLSEIGTIEQPKAMLSIAFVLQLFVLVIVPFTIGILIRLISP